MSFRAQMLDIVINVKLSKLFPFKFVPDEVYDHCTRQIVSEVRIFLRSFKKSTKAHQIMIARCTARTNPVLASWTYHETLRIFMSILRFVYRAWT